MTKIGFALSSELHEPSDLVEQAVRAEELGFDFVALSDHYHPWTPTQGESPFAWTVLGGIAAVTETIDVGTGVTAPIQRYHPAILAQASATAAAMLDGRFYLGVGSGERLNEHVVGDYWPPTRVRLEMLEEAVQLIRALWRGDEITHHGDHYTVENARLFTLPEDPPPIYASAYGPKAARVAARIGDGFYTVGPQGDVLDTYEGNGGTGPAYGQLSVCYADDEATAVAEAHERWPTSALPGELSSQLATPAHFAQAAEMVSEDDIAEGSMVTDPDPSVHVENVETFVDAGFDHVVVHQVGTDVAGCLETYADEVLPAVR